jgi:hypothetical protein
VHAQNDLNTIPKTIIDRRPNEQLGIVPRSESERAETMGISVLPCLRAALIALEVRSTPH